MRVVHSLQCDTLLIALEVGVGDELFDSWSSWSAKMARDEEEEEEAGLTVEETLECGGFVEAGFEHGGGLGGREDEDGDGGSRARRVSSVGDSNTRRDASPLSRHRPTRRRGLSRPLLVVDDNELDCSSPSPK